MIRHNIDSGKIMKLRRKNVGHILNKTEHTLIPHHAMPQITHNVQHYAEGYGTYKLCMVGRF